MSPVTTTRSSAPTRLTAWLQGGQAPFLLLPWLRWVATLAGIGFLVVATAVVSGVTVATDDRIELAVHAAANPLLDVLMPALTVLGLIPTLTVIVVAAGVLLLRARRRFEALLLVVVMLGEGVWDNLIKFGVHRRRPQLFPHAALSSFSFPSGHAMATLCLIGVLLVIVWAQFRPVWRWVFGIMAPILLLGIGLSRVYLGVHYPSDVVAGWCAGAAWLGAALAGARRVAARLTWSAKAG